MVLTNDAPLATAFTVSVDVREGLTTVISATQRCNTARALADPRTVASDFVRPGHVFPLIARDGGVLERAAIPKRRLTCAARRLPPVGVICELVNDDGTVKSGPQTRAFARRHGLRSLSVADLIAYRRSLQEDQDFMQ